MRRTSKASSAGSNLNMNAVDGSFRRRPVAVALALALLALACLLPGSALAGETHQLSFSFGAAGSGDGQLSLAPNSGVAVNEATHDVYVADTGNHRVVQFDSTGVFIRAFGAEVGGAGVNVCTSGCVAGTSASTPGAFEAPTFIAIDNSGGASGGDVYVADTANNLVSKFQANGTLVSSWGVGGQLDGSSATDGPFGELAGIAVDANGNLLAFQTEFEGFMFKFAQDGSFIEDFQAVRGTRQAGIALDSKGNFFKVNGDLSVEKLQSSGTDVGQVSASEEEEIIPTSGLAVDTTRDELFVDHAASIDTFAFGPSGEVIGSGCTPAPEAPCAPTNSFGGGDLSAGAGLGVDGTSHTVYAADPGAAKVRVFGSVLLPDATTEEADAVITTTATLHGTANAQGDQLSDCRFEYGTTTSYGQSAPCVPAAASIPPDSTGHAVKAEVSGLSPNTTYHFRLAVENGIGAGEGLDRVFTTAIGPPTVSAQSVEAVGLSDATLSAKINPKGAPTTYHVEYGTTAAYGQSTPESAAIGFGGDDSDHTVSVHIGGLEPGTAYHFRFVATSAAGSTPGTDTTFATYPSTPSFAPCPNDQFRTGFGARLPDCRAYEQATPTDKHGANIQIKNDGTQASSAGDRITFYLNGGLPTAVGSSSLSLFIASRGSTGWSANSFLPPTEPGRQAFVRGWSADLSTALVSAQTSDLQLSAETIYLRDSDTAAFQPGPEGVFELKNPSFAADTSHLIFESASALVAGAVQEKHNLYDLDHGSLTLVGRIPSGSATSCDDAGAPACVPAPNGAFAGAYSWLSSILGFPGTGNRTEANVISRDGSRVFFTVAGSGKLYVREGGTATTWISASQRTVPDPNGTKPAAFMAATPDGSEVFFTSCEKLTDDSTAVSTAANECTKAGQGQDLYSYDTDTGELTDLSVDSNVSDPKGAAVQAVLGASEDGSYVYFAANGVLAEGASPGSCVVGSSTGTCNLYVTHDGTPAFIAPVSPGKEPDALNNWIPRREAISRVSADGSTLLFSSEQSLTGYDNVGPCRVNFGVVKQVPCSELFRYSAPDKELVCVSCNPSGVSPRAHAALSTDFFFFHQLSGRDFLTRNLSADGNRVFFESKDALLPIDTNGVNDVYEWEAKGSGSCEAESQNGGCIYLLSSGTSPDPSYFADASADGDHVFVFTGQQLVPGDRDQLSDIYDAGVGAGLAAQHALAPPTCSGTACQANPPPPPEQGMASSSFSGPGNAHKRSNARKCPKGKHQVRRAGKVRCLKAGRHQKQKSKLHSNRGGSK